MLILPKQRSIPYGLFEGSTTIDWSKPHAQGLRCYVKVGPGNQGRDLVYGIPLIAQNGATMISTPKGRMINCQGANRGLQGTAAAGQFTFPNKRASILVSGIYRATPDTFTRYAGISYDSSTVSPYDIINIQPSNDFGNYYGLTGYNIAGAQSFGPGRSGSTTPFISVTDGYFHCAGAVADGNQEMYQNGIKGVNGSVSISSINAGTAPQIIFGTYPGQTFNIHADLETLLIWNRELTYQEFRDLWYYGPQLVLRQDRRYFFSQTAGVAQALSGRASSQTGSTPTLKVTYSMAARLESQSGSTTPTLYNTFNFDAVRLESSSGFSSASLGVPLPLTAICSSASGSLANLLNSKILTARLESQSGAFGIVDRELIGGFQSLSVDILIESPTAYFKPGKLPIAYMVNDNDYTGVTDEDIEVSPGYDIF